PIAQAARRRRDAARIPRVNRRPPPAAVAPLPPPPPLPSPRVRVAELATSMISAAPVSALAAALTLPLFPVLGISLPMDPAQLAFLFVLTLLGTWGVLIPSKLWEGREVDSRSKRMLMLAVGLG